MRNENREDKHNGCGERGLQDNMLLAHIITISISEGATREKE
jgi:hypothetical protein